MVPLSTRRLLLRALRPEDLDAVFGILGDEETTAGVSWRQPSRASAAQWLAKRITAEHEHGLSMWGVESVATGS